MCRCPLAASIGLSTKRSVESICSNALKKFRGDGGGSSSSPSSSGDGSDGNISGVSRDLGDFFFMKLGLWSLVTLYPVE